MPTGRLRAYRQVAAAIAAPGSGTGGQNLYMGLIIADGKESGRADPAYDAHTLPIGQWAMAVWEGWETEAVMSRMIQHAKHKLGTAKNRWAAVCGPAAALIMTCERIQWKVKEAAVLVTDLGEELKLRRDPPIVVIKKCIAAVKRWRWKNVEKVMPRLAQNGSGRGAVMEPIWRLLNSKQCDDVWNARFRGSLRSSLAGRQYPQVRVHQCGWSTHNRCLLCLHSIV